MGEITGISWGDHTWNPVIGCTKISPACDGCYAAHLMDTRHHRVKWGEPGKGVGDRVRTSESNWKEPFRWNRKAEKDGTRPFVFCASLADVFDNQWEPEWRADAFDVMRRTPRLVYLLLTKRPGNIARMCEEAGGLPPNCALGTTVEDQQRADHNVPALVLCGLHPLFFFVSCEPLLGPVDLTNINPPGAGIAGSNFFWTTSLRPRIGWVITGGETDQGAHKARPTHPDWFRSLRDQCAAAGIPYHHKQNGVWAPGECAGRGLTRTEEVATFYGEEWDSPGWDFGRVTRRQSEELHRDDEPDVWRMGKARAGRLLDGMLHDARPAVPALEPVHA